MCLIIDLMFTYLTAGTTTHACCATAHATETLNGGNQVFEISSDASVKRIKFFDGVLEMFHF